MRERIVKQEFPDVPESVRNCHRTGSLLFLVEVNSNGTVRSVKPITSICKSVSEYAVRAIGIWKFKPLKISNTPVPFRGVIAIPFCYGSFSDWCHY